MQSRSDAPVLHRAIEGLQRLSDLFEQRREQLARDVGLSVPQWRVLEEVSTESFMPSLFARRRACSAGAVSKTLRPLLKRGLIEVSISAADGRQRDYTLTVAGRRLLGRLRASRRRAMGAIWSDLDGRELARFARFSDALCERLESYVCDQAQPARGKTTRVSKTS